MDEPPDSVIFNGQRYTRQPFSERKWRRHYYLSTHGWRSLHRDVWEHANGRSVPEGYHVHHIDHNPFNNDPSNLCVLTSAEHAAQHAEEHRGARQAWAEQSRPLTKEWHASPEGHAWHVENGRRQWENKSYRDATCEQCGNVFQTRRNYLARHCSRACITAWHRAEGRYQVEVKCPACEQTFKRSKYAQKPETCSRTCGQAMRRLRREASVACR